MKKEERNVTTITESEVSAENSPNMQASLGFTLVGTNLFALFQKKDNVNTFLIRPTDNQPTEGMTIKQMVDEVNALIHGVNPESGGLDADSIQTSIADVAEASKTNPNDSLESINWEDIKVCLKQAFLYLSTGAQVEYALQITVDISKLFPAGQSFFNVSGLSLGIWNTSREKVLKRMDLISVDDCLKELDSDNE